MSEEFSTNERIDDLKIGQNMIDLCGYVSEISSNIKSPASSNKFKKVILNNNRGKQCQVVAWNSNTELLKDVTEIGQIIEVQGTKVQGFKQLSFNQGNVPFELVMEKHSTIDILGSFEMNYPIVPENVLSLSDVVEKLGKVIKIEGIIKTPLGLYTHTKYKHLIGAITDCESKLEVKAFFDLKDVPVNFMEGYTVQICGTVEVHQEELPCLKIERPEDIKILEKDRVPFLNVLFGYKNFL